MKDVNPEQNFVARVQTHFRDLDTRGTAHTSLLRELIPDWLSEGRSFARSLASFAYGDTPPAVVYRLLRRAGVAPSDTFLDLGCGCGIPTLVASRLVERARGVDLLPGVVRVARQAAETLGRMNVHFEVADLREVGAEESVVYCATTAFETDLLEALGERLAQAPPKTRAIVLGRALHHDGLQLQERFACRFSWSGLGEGTKHEVFIYKKV